MNSSSPPPRVESLVRSNWKFRLYLLWKLPGAWFMGVRAKYLDASHCVVDLPYRWRSQNPFRSTYFAAQCAAGEMSTGLLCLAAIPEKEKVSMLVVSMNAVFHRKANQTLSFTCADGALAHNAVRQTIRTGEPATLEMLSVGTLPDGSIASEVRIFWSFKHSKK